MVTVWPLGIQPLQMNQHTFDVTKTGNRTVPPSYCYRQPANYYGMVRKISFLIWKFSFFLLWKQPLLSFLAVDVKNTWPNVFSTILFVFFLFLENNKKNSKQKWHSCIPIFILTSRLSIALYSNLFRVNHSKKTKRREKKRHTNFSHE